MVCQWSQQRHIGEKEKIDFMALAMLSQSADLLHTSSICIKVRCQLPCFLVLATRFTNKHYKQSYTQTHSHVFPFHSVQDMFVCDIFLCPLEIVIKLLENAFRPESYTVAMGRRSSTERTRSIFFTCSHATLTWLYFDKFPHWSLVLVQFDMLASFACVFSFVHFIRYAKCVRMLNSWTWTRGWFEAKYCLLRHFVQESFLRVLNYECFFLPRTKCT